jgi:hypothetical protein
MLRRVLDFLFSRSRAYRVKSGTTLKQISDWLKKLGLSEYAQRNSQFASGKAEWRPLSLPVRSAPSSNGVIS